MKIMNKQLLKKATIGLTSLVVALLISGSAASAIQYTGDTTVASPVPAFNVFTGDMPAPAPAGGEGNFFRGRVPVNGNPSDATTQYSDPVNTNCTDGQIIQMNVYVHNGANADANNNGSGPSVAHGTKVKVSLPSANNVSSTFDSSATISATNAASVSDGLSINCNGHKVKLQYVAGSASQFSAGSGVVALPDSIVSDGALIRSHQVPGDVWGCWNERVYVVLSVKVVEVPTTPPVSAQCEMFSIVASEDRKVTINKFAVTQTNESLKSVVVNWGDNSALLNATSEAGVLNQTHQYANEGTFNITAVATFAVAGQADIVSGGAGTACAQQVTFTHNQPPVVTTVSKPTQLVNTGAGSVAGIFAATTALGAGAYRWMLGRRLSRQ
jgi:hypothetical protein